MFRFALGPTRRTAGAGAVVRRIRRAYRSSPLHQSSHGTLRHPDLEVDVLRAFMAVAETGSFTAARMWCTARNRR